MSYRSYLSRKSLVLVSLLSSISAAAGELEGWSLRDKASQLLLLGFHSLKEIETMKPGGVVLYAWNMKGVDVTKKLTQDLEAIAKKNIRAPLIIATDHEGGKVLRLRKGLTNFPDAAAVGSLQDSFTAFQVGKFMGLELSALGINTNLAPVLDLGNARSFLENRIWGEEANEVGELTGAFIRGLHSSGVLAVAKHFPGHGGTTVDSHFALPQIHKTLDALWKEDLAPFRKVIQEDVPAIMTAHVEIPAIDRGPASLSEIFIQKTLRDRMGFKGLVVTDDLEMAGAVSRAGVKTEDLAIKALDAGSDMILVAWSKGVQEKILNRIVAAVEKGERPASWLDEKVERILKAKKNYFCFEDCAENPLWKQNLRRAEATQLVEKIASGAIHWEAGDRQQIFGAFAQRWEEKWTVLLPSKKAEATWKLFRAHDEICVLQKRPDTAALARIEQLLRASEREQRPLLVVTGPRASSSEEIFRLVRSKLSDFNSSPEENWPILWGHQGPNPIRVSAKVKRVKIGVLSLHSSQALSLSSFLKYLKNPEQQRPLSSLLERKDGGILSDTRAK